MDGVAPAPEATLADFSEADADREDDEPELHVSRIACGLQSVPADISPDVVTLCLHGNFIADVGTSLTAFAQLVDLNLSSNSIESMQGFHALPRLRVLNLACNKIAKVAGLSGMASLETIDLSHNVIDDVGGFYDVPRGGKSVRDVRLKDNKIGAASDLLPLRKLGHLESLELCDAHHSNPLCGDPGYYAAVLNVLPQIKVLDANRGSVTAEPPAGPHASEPTGPAPHLASEPAQQQRRPLQSPPPEQQSRQDAPQDAVVVPRVVRFASSSAQTDPEPDVVSGLEQEAFGIQAQLEDLKQSFQDYEGLRAVVRSLREEHGNALQRQERIVRQEMEIFVHEKSLERDAIARALEASEVARARTEEDTARAEAATAGAKAELATLADAHATAVTELKSLEAFAEELTAKVEEERGRRQNAERRAQETVGRLNTTLAESIGYAQELARAKDGIAGMRERASEQAERCAGLEAELEACRGALKGKEEDLAREATTSGRLEADLALATEALTRSRAEKAALVSAFDRDVGARMALHRKAQERQAKDAILGCFDAMDAAMGAVKARAHDALNAQEARLMRFGGLRKALASHLEQSQGRYDRALREKRETERLLEELAQVSEGLQTQVASAAHEHARMKRAISKQRAELERLSGLAREHDALRGAHAALQADHERECDAARRLRIAQDALEAECAKREADAERSKRASRAELERAEATLQQALAQESKLQHLGDEVNSLGQVVRMKDGLLDDKDAQVASLDASLAQERKDRHAMAEAHARVLDEMKATMDSLQDELAAADASLSEERALREAVASELATATEGARAKDGMLQYVRTEVDRLKALFASKETSLARAQEASAAEAAEARERERARAAEATAAMAEAREAADGRRSAEDRLAQALAELGRAEGRVSAVEGEMRVLLKAVEKERYESVVKVQRVQAALKDLAIQ